MSVINQDRELLQSIVIMNALEDDQWKERSRKLLIDVGCSVFTSDGEDLMTREERIRIEGDEFKVGDVISDVAIRTQINRGDGHSGFDVYFDIMIYNSAPQPHRIEFLKFSVQPPFRIQIAGCTYFFLRDIKIEALREDISNCLN